MKKTTLEIDHTRIESVRILLEVLTEDGGSGNARGASADESQRELHAPIVRRIRSVGQDS